MYYVEGLVGKVVTLKTQKGEEFIAKLIGVDDKRTVLTVSNPKIVVIAGESVALVPFALTAKSDTVFLQTDQLLTVMETIESSAEDYLDMIAAEKEFENSAATPINIEEDETEEA